MDSLANLALLEIFNKIVDPQLISKYQRALEARAHTLYVHRAQDLLLQDGYVIVDRPLKEFDQPGTSVIKYLLEIKLAQQAEWDPIQQVTPPSWPTDYGPTKVLSLELIPRELNQDKLAAIYFEELVLGNYGISATRLTGFFTVYCYWREQQVPSSGTYWCLTDTNEIVPLTFPIDIEEEGYDKLFIIEEKK